MKEKIENKKALIAAVRIAKGPLTPEAAQFWEELKERMDIREHYLSNLVKPREKRH